MPRSSHASTPSSLSPSPPKLVSADHLLVATAIRQGQKWNSAQEFARSLAIAVPGCLHNFVQFYTLQPKHDHQRFLLQCADHTNTQAQRDVGEHYDTATALITKVEDVQWGEAAVRYVCKGEEFDEALEKLKSDQVPFDGSTISQAEVRKLKALAKKSAAKSTRAKLLSRTGRTSAAKTSLKRKRGNDESPEEEVKRLVKQARNAGEKRTISEAEKLLLVRYLADLPPSVSWDSVLNSFVENGNSGCRYSIPTWAHLLRKEKIWFEQEVALIRASANKPHT
ncbi:hypothetical protein FRC04_009439 [Tulasnella sp. 424]|nr:hypothetical protein FRC04_009439 [Tulasnella sp. 424]KAG8971891.1 hypothetical protein FRC05_010560 [Tulasnella sp. 425]